MALLCVVFIIFFSTCEAKLHLPKDVNITGIFAFGDSIVDQGNNNNLITRAKCNYLPYGKDFMGGNKPTGRFSNARTPADMLVEDFGIKKLMPAYLDSNLKLEDLKTGVSFASGASGFDLLTPIVASALPLPVQLALFQQYIWKMNRFIGEEEAKHIVKKSLYIVVSGSDDLCNTYFMLKFPRKIQYNIDSYTNLMVDEASNFVNDLYNMGARRIWIFGLPPIGCLPSQKLRGGGLPNVCVDEYNEAAQITNTKLSAKIYSLNKKLPQSELLYINIYDPLLDIIVNHDKYGFEDAKSPCCPGDNEFLLCDNITKICENDAKYLFWDSYHLTEKVEELGIKELLPAYLDPFLQAEDLITGVNFASGGAGYDPLTSELAKVISLNGQLILFKEYIIKLTMLVGEDRKNEILANSLYMLVTGANDITNTYFGMPLRKSYYDVPSYADLLVNFASIFVQDLYGLGARRIGVFGIPPLGCLPSQRTLKGGEERQCVDYLNQAAQVFNSKLEAYTSSQANKLHNSRLVYVDTYNVLLDVINNPQRYGFKIADKGCCGTGKIEVAELCTYTCSSDSDYIFWDSFHLTEKAYRLLAHQVVVQHLSRFF